ncbi:MAG: transposase [Cyanobacteria bacterium P01_A01_bin.83]
MKQVERHIVKRSNPIWQQIDRLCFLSKNLYNYANYQLRQKFIWEKIYLGYNKLYHLVKSTSDYQALPAKVSQQVLKLLDKNWQSFFAANKAYKIAPDKFTGRPKLPNYKDKIKGRNSLVYTIQAISKSWLKKGIVKLSGTDISVKTKVSNIHQARIIPQTGQYIIEVVYEKPEYYIVTDQTLLAAIDIGVNNLAALTSNKSGFIPVLINGRPLKSLNQFYNKQKAKLQSQLANNQKSSQQIQRLTANRNNRINSYLHKVSRWVINYLDKQRIGKLIIGNNPGWKQSCNLGKSVNQSFVSISHHRLIEMLIYKGKLLGIEVIVREESYTSRASFLSLDPIPNHGDKNAASIKFSGYRESRGMYKQKGSKTRINADVQASYNLMRKVIPEIFDRRGIGGAVVRPIRVTPN